MALNTKVITQVDQVLEITLCSHFYFAGSRRRQIEPEISRKGSGLFKAHNAMLTYDLSKHGNGDEGSLDSRQRRHVPMSLTSRFKPGKGRAVEELQRDEGSSSARSSGKVQLAVSLFAVLLPARTHLLKKAPQGPKRGLWTVHFRGSL